MTFSKKYNKHNLLYGISIKRNIYDDNTVATEKIENGNLINVKSDQAVPGILLQDKYRANDKTVIVGGLRLDYYNKHDFGIPSLNVCMNCHQNIAEYNGEEDLEKGYTREFYTNEIKKLYKAVGWDENSQSYTGETEPVKWIRIHNLPDFVYFNHAQHVTVAGVDCKKCHGPVEEMEILYQHSSLTMGWCINCHRETNVKLKDNEYYAKIHEELSKKYGVEELTAAQMGGLECGKCHY